MRIGSLDRLVVIQEPSTSQDAAGQPVATWTTVVTVWANIRHLSGVESIKANADTSIVKASIRIRRRTNITSAMRVVHGTDTYEIKAVLPDEESRQRLDLSCEMVNGG